MRCACKACGTYMIQDERGLMSGCRCPECANACRDCMGSVEAPLSVEELRGRFANADISPGSASRPAEPPEWAQGWRSWTKQM